jgi:type IV secretion system protein TrbI
MEKNKLNIEETPNLLDKNINDDGVKKLNKAPIIIISLALIAVLIVLFYAAMQRGVKNEERSKPNEQKNVSYNDQGVDKLISELNTSIKSEPAPEVKKDTLIVDTKPTTEIDTKPTVTTKPKLSQEEMEVIRLKRQLALKALTGPTQLDVKVETPKDNNNLNLINNLLSTNKNSNSNVNQDSNKLMQNYIKNLNSGNQTVNNDDRNQDFLNRETSYDYLRAKKTALLSPYEVKTGTMIPAVMITGANSDLPGKITGQVRENVYDSATGEYLLIPQGTRLIGEYSANVVYGQERLLVAWNRLIFPDGATLNLGKMLGTAGDGYTGFHDQVDNHYFRIFGSAFLMSAISAGVQLSSGDSNNQYVETNTDKAIGGAIQQLGQVGTEMIRKNLDISPTLNIRPGYRFNIFVTKDIILEPLGY